MIEYVKIKYNAGNIKYKKSVKWAPLIAKRAHVSKFWTLEYYKRKGDFPGCTVVKNLPANAGDMDSIPGPGRSHTPRSN